MSTQIMDRTKTMETTLTSVMVSTQTNLATTTIATTATESVTATSTQVVMETMLGSCLQKVRRVAQVLGHAADLTDSCSAR